MDLTVVCSIGCSGYRDNSYTNPTKAGRWEILGCGDGSSPIDSLGLAPEHNFRLALWYKYARLRQAIICLGEGTILGSF